MIYGPLKVMDKTGHEVVLRSAQITDAENLINYLKITAAETPWLIREPEEVTLSFEQERSCNR